MTAALAAAPPDAARTFPLPGPLDFVRTLAPIVHGRGDATIRLTAHELWRASRTPDGPGSLHLRLTGAVVAASAWGPGADWLIGSVPGLIGLEDDAEALVPRHAVLRDLVHRHPGLRLPRTGLPFEALLPAICEQKVTGDEARRAFRAMVRTHGETAPGPAPLRLPPHPSTLAALRYFAFHPLGLERRRAEVVIRAARSAPRLAGLDRAHAYRLLASVPGIGPWTIAETGRVAYGDPDAISIGDYHLPNLVAWALAGEPRADDARMLELLEPYRGQRARVQRLLEASGIRPPRYGPRLSPRRIKEI